MKQYKVQKVLKINPGKIHTELRKQKILRNYIKILPLLLLLMFIISCNKNSKNIEQSSKKKSINSLIEHKEISLAKSVINSKIDIAPLISYDAYAIVKIDINRVINNSNIMKDFKTLEKKVLIQLIKKYIENSDTKARELRNVYFVFFKIDNKINKKKPLMIFDINYKKNLVNDFIQSISINPKKSYYNNKEYLKFGNDGIYYSNNYIALGSEKRILELIDIEKGVSKNIISHPLYKKILKNLKREKQIIAATLISGPIYHILSKQIPGVNFDTSSICYIEIEQNNNVLNGMINIYSTDSDTNRRNINKLELIKSEAQYLDKEVYNFIKKATFYYDKKKYGVRF